MAVPPHLGLIAGYIRLDRPHFRLACGLIEPGQAVIFTPPDSRTSYNRMDFTLNDALTPGLRDHYYKYPTSPNWVLLPVSKEKFSLSFMTHRHGQFAFFDTTLSILDNVNDQYTMTCPSLMYHNSMRRPYLARQSNATFEDKIYQTSGRIPHNYTSDITYVDSGGITYGSTSINPALHALAYQLIPHDMVNPVSVSKSYNPYKYFNPRAKIMERADLNYRKTGTLGSTNVHTGGGPIPTAIHNASENYFYNIQLTDMNNASYLTISTYGENDEYVSIGGGIRDPIAERMILYDVPTGTTGLYSLGQLQHFQLSDYFDEAGYAIGNSLQSPHLDGDELFHPGIGVVTWMDQGNNVEGTVDYSTIDLSWVCNDALWDRYFFSTTANLTQQMLDNQASLPNPRLKIRPAASLAALKSSTLAASQLFVKGAFNVNSTSVDAWKSLLAGNHARYEDTNNSPISSPFFRLFKNDLSALDDQNKTLSQGHSTVDDSASTNTGETALERLAKAIVEQVKKRGPFTSLAEFVNRKRILEPNDDPALQLSGALQSAIDSSEINVEIANNLKADYANIQSMPDVSGFGDFGSSYAENKLKGSSIEGLPGMVSQADILTAIGPFITTRSDTFTIMSYGEYTNVHTGEKSKALLELKVQRLPEYMDSSNDAVTTLPADLTQAINIEYGRRFTILSSRWLNAGSTI